MTLDKNTFCPCGSGKKIKFCCKDLAKTLEKIVRAVEGQQYEAAIALIDKATEEHPQAPAVWAIKTTVLMQTGRFDEAEAAVDEFVGFAPENPIALASSAVLKITTMAPPVEGDDPEAFAMARDSIVSSATATLHRALAHSPSQMPVQVYEAVGLIGQFLIETGHLLAGREHLLFQYAVSPNQAERTTQLLVETSRSRDVPLLFKQETSLPAPVDWVHWKEDYIAAREMALRGAWTPAAAKIKTLIDANEPHAVLLQAYATLCCRLPDETTAVEALRAVVAFGDVDHDEAVEAEALALLLDQSNEGEMVDIVLATVPLKDAESSLEKLQSDRRAELLRMDFSSMGDEDNPPPKSGFMMLDREMPTADKLTIDAIPHAFGECLLYGKQTDKAARLEIVCSRTQLDKLTPILKDILGDDVAGEAEEKVVEQIPVNVDKMTVKPIFPREAPRDFQSQYVRDVERRQLLEVWPSLAQPGLDGKSAKEAAGNPDYERKLQGAILSLQVRRGAQVSPEEFDTLRKQLNLAEPPQLKLESAEVRRLPLVRLSRLDLESASTEDLALCFIRASQNAMSSMVLKIGQALITREPVDGGLAKAEVYGRMAQNTTDTVQAIDWLQKAQEESRASGQSPAAWMISEMTYRLIAGQGAEAQAIMNKIQTDHINEPGVAQMLMQTLQQLGLVGPEGQPQQAMPGGPAAAAAPEAAAPPSSGVWTPDSGSAPQPSAAPAEQKKSAIWTPGMD